MFVETYREKFWNAFEGLLQINHTEGIKDMYMLLNKSSALGSLPSQFESVFKLTALQRIERLSMRSNEDESEDYMTPIDCNVYMQEILSIHRTYSHILEYCFERSKDFAASFERACKYFVNNNAICNNIAATMATSSQTTKQSTSKSAELLARYADTILKKSQKQFNDVEMETAQKEIMLIFRHLEEKDVFQVFYSRRLCVRLINGLSISDDAEETMLNKLREECGYEYVAKLQRMFTDMRLSNDISQSFHNHLKSLGNEGMTCELENIHVLTHNTWPVVQSTNVSAIILPSSLSSSLNNFEQFYSKQFNNRKLQWLHNFSKLELKSFYLTSNKIFNTNIYQALLLLLFNDETLVNMMDIKEKTQMPLPLIEQTTKQLLDHKIIVQISSGMFKLNNEYVNKKVRVILNGPTKIEQKQEIETTQKVIIEDRKPQVQACIVRIMKSRKTLHYNDLIAQTIEMLKLQYQPSISFIKQMIEILIEKEYIQRGEVDKNMFTYLA
jgi:cullin 1